MIKADVLYFADLPDKIVTAERILQAHGPRLLVCEVLRAELHALHVAADEVQRAMRASGMTTRCTACGVGSGGGCCGASIADEVYSMLLVVNGLLGVTPALQTADPTSCAFLGATGCSLRVKPILCLNYTCHDLNDTLPLRGLDDVAKTTRLLLNQLISVERHIEQLLESSPGGEHFSGPAACIVHGSTRASR
jgi:hypothetical protein